MIATQISPSPPATIQKPTKASNLQLKFPRSSPNSIPTLRTKISPSPFATFTPPTKWYNFHEPLYSQQKLPYLDSSETAYINYYNTPSPEVTFISRTKEPYASVPRFYSSPTVLSKIPSIPPATVTSSTKAASIKKRTPAFQSFNLYNAPPYCYRTTQPAPSNPSKIPPLYTISTPSYTNSPTGYSPTIPPHEYYLNTSRFVTLSRAPPYYNRRKMPAPPYLSKI